MMNRIQAWKLVAFTGFISFTGFIIAVRSRPISGYELSIYAAVPFFGWFLFFITLTTGIIFATNTNISFFRKNGFIILLLVGIGIGGLPLFRGYHAYVSQDTLVHIGYVIDILNGKNIPRLNVYPGLHYTTAELSLISGVSIERSLMTILFIFSVLFVTFTGLSTRQLFGSLRGVGIGAVIGVLFAPIMGVRLPVFAAVPATVAIFFVSICIFVLIRYMYLTRRIAWRNLFILLPVSLTIYHPQHAVAFTLSLTAIAVFLYLWKPSRDYRLDSVAIFLAAILSALVILIMVKDAPKFIGAIASILTGIMIGSGGNGVGDLSGTAAGLSELGGSLIEIAVKILLPKIVVALIAVAIVLIALRDVHYNTNPTRSNIVVLCLAVGAAPILGMVFLYIGIGLLNQATRYAGYMLVFASVIAGLGVNMITGHFEQELYLKVAMAALALIVVVISIPALYTSPYLYQSSGHFPGSEQTGYEFAFEYHNEGIGIASTRSPVHEHQIAYMGRVQTRANPTRASLKTDRVSRYYLPYHFNGTLPSDVVNQTTYFVIPESDRKTDLKLYDGYRYSEADYNRVATDKQVTKFYANGHFDLYLIHN